jgi:acetaldehyde dehydrogenase (acetylating)
VKGLDPDLRSLQEVRDQVARAKAATKTVAGYSQEQIDRVCKAMAEAGARAAYDLARLAVEETGIGRVHYKILKNLLGSEGVWDSIKDERTVGFLKRDEARGLHEVATPVGVVAGIVPTTNPTSTAMFKAIIAVKGRNGIVISPHPRAKRCIGEAVEIMRRAIERAGAPADLVTCLANPTIESTGALMKHRDVAVILSTGGAGLVRAAYSSGKPAYGVGPGNVPAYVDRSADLARVAEDVVTSQSFDNGTLCCSEQALVLDRPIADKFLGLMVARGAHLCCDTERRKLEAYANVGGHMNPDLVGLDPWRIAEGAGFQVPRSTTVLLAHQDGVGREHPLSIEILCPLLSVHTVDGWQEGCAVSKATLHFGGLGHTMAVHATDSEVLDAFFLDKPASRIVANGPSSMGAVGFSTNLVPSFSLGCGPQAGNITSENITARHLLNIKRVAFPRRDWKEIERRYHERAAAMTGDPAPRGSGLAGDPGLGGSPPAPIVSSPLPTNAALPRPVSSPSPVPSPGFAPTFTRPAAAPAVAVTPRRAQVPVPAPRVAPPTRTADVGGALSPDEIRSILEHAGDGCPMGPCKGCSLQDVRTGSCQA